VRSVSHALLEVGQAAQNAEVLLSFRAAFGGAIGDNGRQSGLRQQVLKWIVCGGNARHAASVLARYSLLKKQQLATVASSPPVCKEERKDLAEKLQRLKSEPPSIKNSVSWPYLAGFFDAEGCIAYDSQSCSLQLEIAQKHPEGLKAIVRFLASQDPPVTASLNPGKVCISKLSDVKVVLRRLLEAGLLGKRQQAELALNAMSESGEFSESYFEAREKGAALKGLQMRYQRLTPAGCIRACEIRLVLQRLYRCQRKGDEADAAQAQLELKQLRATHAASSALESYALLRADIRQRLQLLSPAPTSNPILFSASASNTTSSSASEAEASSREAAALGEERSLGEWGR
jgi:hypothetical protein